jgi:hypothetical protein
MPPKRKREFAEVAETSTTESKTAEVKAKSSKKVIQIEHCKSW